MKECLIVCNGHFTKKELNSFTKLNKPRRVIDIIACDGASDFLRKHKVLPDVIIGDLDSVKPATLKYFSAKKVPAKKVYDQNKNDLEKALLFSLGKKYKLIHIIGLSGKRLDHTLNNISVLKKYHRKADMRFYENGFTGRIISKKLVRKCRVGDIVSLIPLPKTTGITTSGLKYPLKNGSLEFGERSGALNETVSEVVNVTLKKGCLIILNKSDN